MQQFELINITFSLRKNISPKQFQEIPDPRFTRSKWLPEPQIVLQSTFCGANFSLYHQQAITVNYRGASLSLKLLLNFVCSPIGMRQRRLCRMLRGQLAISCPWLCPDRFVWCSPSVILLSTHCNLDTLEWIPIAGAIMRQHHVYVCTQTRWESVYVL